MVIVRTAHNGPGPSILWGAHSRAALPCPSEVRHGCGHVLANELWLEVIFLGGSCRSLALIDQLKCDTHTSCWKMINVFSCKVRGGKKVANIT